MNLEFIYNVSPYWLQNLMCSAKGYLIKRRRFNKQFLVELDHFEKEYYDPRQQLVLALQNSKKVEFYREYLTDDFYRDLSVDNADEKIKALPIINKAIIKVHQKELVNPLVNEKVRLGHTSGTTGSGLIFPYTLEIENKQWAVWWRYRRALGIQLDTWCGWLGGRTIIPVSNTKAPFWRINKPCKQVMYSSHHLSASTVQFYYDDIKKRNLSWLHGYPSSAAFLSSLIVEKGLPPIESVKWITTGAENLLEHQIKMMHQAFPNAMVRTHYGLSESVANFSQDISGKWKIDYDFAYPEFVPVDEAKPSICRIVGTNFYNKAFPLIRYDTGDLAKVNWVDGKPEIVEIYGRQEDYIELPNGVKLGRLDHVFKDCVNIREAQIHQIRQDLIELRVVKDQNYSQKDEDLLIKEASSRFGKEVELKISYCERIERTKAGKVRFVVSELVK